MAETNLWSYGAVQMFSDITVEIWKLWFGDANGFVDEVKFLCIHFPKTTAKSLSEKNKASEYGNNVQTLASTFHVKLS